VHDHHALVPNAGPTAMLVVDGRLPVVRTHERDLRETMAALEREYGVTAPFLRVVRRSIDRDERVTTLFEVDAASVAGDWLALEQVDPASVAPVFADGVAQWLAEQRGAPVPPERPPWARSGWLGEASAWVAEQVPVAGAPELVRQWPLSSVYRYPTTGAPLYLKAVFALFRHEPAVTAALATGHGGAVPDVVTIDPERGLLLMREFGPELGDRNAPLWADGVRTTAEIQRAWAGRGKELRALGAPARGLDSLRAETEGVEALRAAWARMAGLGLPDTIVHGDLHPWNAVVEPHGIRIVDWSDAAVGPPYLDLAVALFHVLDDEVRARLVQAYLEPWRGAAPEANLHEAAVLGEVLGSVYQSVSYRHINTAFEANDRWLFADEERRWLDRAIELASHL
jgi:Phosphotransferase enzyme family